MTKREMPAALYAAAGAGDLAYQQLRRLPETASRTLRAASEAAGTLRGRVASGESRLNRDRLATDLAKVRESAQRGATVFLASASVAQDRAVTGYRTLVAHGEQVVAARAGGRGEQPAQPELTGATGDSAGPAASADGAAPESGHQAER